MKKILSLMITLCLLCMSAATLAETAKEATKLELDGFTLNLTNGEFYTVNEKVANQPYIVVLPFYASGDMTTNYTFAWNDGVFELTIEGIKTINSMMEQQLRTLYGSYGYTIDSFTIEDPYEATLSDTDCFVVDMVTVLSNAGQKAYTYQRQIYIPSIDHYITLSTTSPEALETITQQIADSITF